MGGRAITWTEKPCKRCTRIMIPQLVWRADPAARKGHVRHGAGDHCNGCYKTLHKRKGAVAKPKRSKTGPSLAEQRGLTGDQHRAALAVCSRAADRDEAAAMLDMLGLLAPATRSPGDIGSTRWST